MLVTKFSVQLSLASERASSYLEKAKNALTPLPQRAADGLQELRYRSANDLRTLRATSHDALVVAIERIVRLAWRISAASKQMAVDFHTAQKTVAVLGRHAVDHLQTAYQESDNALRKLGAGCRDAIVAADQKKDRLGSRISAASKQVAAHLQKAWNSFGALGRSIADKPRMRREARWARENDLRNLLASSSQALVVTDGNRRLVAANRKALQLFGISEFNMSNFTIDAFLANVEIPKVDGNGLPFVTREDEPNRCKIRRLDGGLRVAECEFVADIVPSRDLYKFQNAAPYRITPPRFAKTSGRVATPRTVETQSIPVPNETKPTKKLPRHGVRPVL